MPPLFPPRFSCSDLRQHYFQRLQRRRRRVQLWPRTRLVLLRDPSRAHVGLPWLSRVNLRPSCLDGCLPHLSGDSRVHLAASNVLHLLTSCLGNLMYPSSYCFIFSFVLFASTRACRCVPVHLTLHPHFNLPRGGNRPYTCVNKS